VELAIELSPATAHTFAAIFFLVSVVFVHRSFYGMRIPAKAAE
jgi:K(+)-stimulated pyrophosphate-energized sodium pump